MNKAKIITDAHCYIPKAHVRGRMGKGKASCGVLIIDERGKEYCFSKYLGEMTVPEAEFNALIFGLDQATAIVRWDVEVWMDSELVIKWMNGDYRIKKEHIRPLFDTAKKFSQRFKSINYYHHSRESELAKRADALARQEFERIQSGK